MPVVDYAKRPPANAHAAPNTALVAAVGWLIPGGGYLLIGHRARGITIGVTVVTLFVLGLLFGGLRVLEVPFYNRLGERIPEKQTRLIDELRAKPWSIAQTMTGPVGIAGGYASTWASQPVELADGSLAQRGLDVHGRVSEIAVLYTAVAGMLNLLAIIDAAHRASKMQERRR